MQETIVVNEMLNGTGVPANTIGTDGDYYIDNSSSPLTIYGPKAAGAWPAGISLQGPTGATGATGAPGPQGQAGTNGNTVLNGSGAPSNPTGNNGDFYIDTAAWYIYGPKAAGAWPAGVALTGGSVDKTQPWGPVNNNVNALLQRDQWGNDQNLAYLDADTDLVIGPGANVQIFPYMKAPLNFWRQTIFDDFNMQTLSGLWVPSVTGAGSYGAAGASKLKLETGASAIGDGVEIDLANYSTDITWDAMLWFLLEAPTAGYFDLQFGFKCLSNNARAFLRRYDQTGTATNWSSHTQTEGGSALGTSGTLGADNMRRVGCVWLQGDQVSFYVGDAGNTLQLLATHTTDLPATGTPLVPYLSFHSANSAADRTCLVDQIAYSGNK